MQEFLLKLTVPDDEVQREEVWKAFEGGRPQWALCEALRTYVMMTPYIQAPPAKDERPLIDRIRDLAGEYMGRGNTLGQLMTTLRSVIPVSREEHISESGMPASERYERWVDVTESQMGLVFKPDDVVKCRDNGSSKLIFSMNYIVERPSYTPSPNYIKLKGDATMYAPQRFELVSREEKIPF